MKRRRSQLIILAVVVLLFAGLLGLWHWLDHSMPAPDDSSYILGSFQYADLLKHPKFWTAHWWYSMLTVNRVYPPTVMLTNGVLRLVCGHGNWVNVLSVMIFSAVLTATVYGTTRLISNSHIAAILAAVIVNLYPQTSCMSHCFLLDAPLMSMVSLGIFALLWWRKNRTWSRAIICALGLGLACLTKQIAAAYLLGPGLFLLGESILSDVRCREWRRSRQLIVIAVATVLVGLPWLLTNMPYIRFLAEDNQAYMGKLSLWQVFPRSFSFYVQSLPSIMSPFLLAVFLVSFVMLAWKKQWRLTPLALSALGGMTLISTLTWSFTSLRYIAPFMLASAAYTGCALGMLHERARARLLVYAIIGLGALQFISFNFSPYPIARPAFIAQLSDRLGVNLVEIIGLTQRDRRVSQVRHSNPQPAEDWGQEWALNTIDGVEQGKPVYLNILPDYVQLNGNTFELVARLLGSTVRPTTSRRWTVMGDIVRFEPKVALYYQWFLLKSGYQGNLLRDKESEKNYAALVDFVEHSGKFKLMGSHKLPDQSCMYLYRQD